MAMMTDTHCVSYFADGTPYSYSRITRDGRRRLFNAGWLDEGHPFPIGPVSTEFVRRLIVLSKNPVMLYRGIHPCPFCPPPPKIDWTKVREHDDKTMGELMELGIIPSHEIVDRFEGEEWAVFANGEIRVAEPNGKGWAAPPLIVHYVLSHGYVPPTGFISAVLRGRAIDAPHWA